MKRTDEKLKKKLAESFGPSVKLDEPMARHIRFQVGGPADIYFTPENKAELVRFLSEVNGKGLELNVIGRGTNLLVKDGGIRGVVISMTCGFRETSWIETGGQTRLRLGASVSMDDAVDQCVHKGMAGLEFAAGIPGNVGGAVVMNAGTREGDVAGTVRRVHFIDLEGSAYEMDREQIRFEYRSANLTTDMIVIGAEFGLEPGSETEIKRKADLLLQWRKQNHPIHLPCAGSVFKNPGKIPAGRLIDEAGLKGIKIGRAAVSDLHTNFIVNLGGATAGQILDLVRLVHRTVRERTGVYLEPEIKILGEELNG